MDIEEDEQVGRSVALIFAVVALDLAASNCSFILNSSRATLITAPIGQNHCAAVLRARHLVAQHEVRHLLLSSRKVSADALRQELAATGANVMVAACDVSAVL